MYARGFLRYEQGEEGEAEQWLRKAAAAGHAQAMYNLGALLYKPGSGVEAEQWWRKAAAAGDADGTYCLAGLLHEQGRRREAKQWAKQWRRMAAAARQGAWGQPKWSHEGSGMNQEWTFGWKKTWGNIGPDELPYVPDMPDQHGPGH